MKHITKYLATALLGLSLVGTQATAAIEIDENEGFGPTYSSTVADITIAKPLQVVGAVIGTGLHVVGLPFSYASNSVDESYETLVRQPWSSLQRCVGCTGAYDDYIKSTQQNKDEVRFVVDQPSEVIINTDAKVTVNQ